MTNNINLKPKFDLLNSNFDGYKLKSDPSQSVYTRQIENGIFQGYTPDATCYLYTRMESLHNHLFSDPNDAHTVYVFNKKGHLLLFTFNDQGYVAPPVVVWQEDLVEQSQKESTELDFTFSPSISFPSSSFALTSNGSGLLNILETGDRGSESSWVNLKEVKVACGTLVHSLLIDVPEDKISKQELHALLLSVTTSEQLKSDPLHSVLHPHLRNTTVSALHIIFWFTFRFDGAKWEMDRERRVAGFKSLEYVSLDPACHGLVLLSHDNYYFIYDSQHPLQEAKEAQKKIEKNLLKYIFMQNSEEIKLWINVGKDVTKSELHIDVRVRDMKIKVKDDIVFEKKFLNPVDIYASTWKIDEGNLEICIPKAQQNVRWTSLFEGEDDDGEEVMDVTLVAEVHQRLAHLTSDEWSTDPPDPEKLTFNPGQLEACDDASEDLFLYILDDTTHVLSHSSHLGAVQHLCNVQRELSMIPAFCLRQDVDGLLWQLNEDRTFEHVSTFHAFGYVKASKSMAKFTEASPDSSYVAVADVNSHVYVFCQPGSFGGKLRNRKSGKVSTTIARQLVISLRNHDEVMGFHAAQNCIFVLTHTDLFVYTLHL